MKSHITTPLLLVIALASGCAEMGTLGGTQYGDTAGTVASQADRNGRMPATNSASAQPSAPSPAVCWARRSAAAGVRLLRPWQAQRQVPQPGPTRRAR